MAESRRYGLVNQLDIEQILLEAQNRWLRPAEICEILRNHQNFRIAPEPPNKPPSGSLFLFDRKVLRYFRKDGHNWRKKKDGKTVKEAHERLKAGSVDVLHCYYAHGEENENFQRRSYWMLEEDFMHIVLVHYREVKGNKMSFGGTRVAEEVIPNSQYDSHVPSSFQTDYNQAPSLTTDTSLNSALTSEYEDVESVDHQANSRYHSFLELQQQEDRPLINKMDAADLLNSYFPDTSPNDYQGKQPAIPGLKFVSLLQENGTRESKDTGFASSFEPRRQLDLTSWEEVLEHRTTGSQGASLQPSISSSQAATLGIIPKQEHVLGKLFMDEFNIKEELLSQVQSQEKWQIASEDDPSQSKWSMDQKLPEDLTYDLATGFLGQKTNYTSLNNPSEPLCLYPDQKNGHTLENGLQVQLSSVETGRLVISNSETNHIAEGKYHNSFNVDYSRTDDSLKKIDSFNQWMSKELGEVEESHMPSNSGVYWDADDGENVSDNSSMSPQVNLDAYLLSPSLSQDQLFSIIDFSPNWAYTDSETKVLITGTFLKHRQDAQKCKWSCMFGEVEVPAEVLADGVLRCRAPLHAAGRVPFYVTCSNRLASSEVREFEFRDSFVQDMDATDPFSNSTSEMLLHIRLGKLLSLGSNNPKSLTGNLDENFQLSNRISLLMKEEDEWSQMVKRTSEKEFSPGEVKEQLLQTLLKEKLLVWLLHKITEEGKGPSVLDSEGQGVLHLAAALDYDWAIEPTVAAGVNINFRDVNGWTALHWAAFCGRERTVATLVQLDAAPGALTDPTPKFPSGRAPADLASSNGHKGIAGYLAESSLTTHLSTLTLKDTKGVAVSGLSGEKAVETVLERSATPFGDTDAPGGLSLKDSLTAVRNAAQAADRIRQVFRIQSFHKKQLIEYGDDKAGMSDERALSLVSVKTHRLGQHDEPVHAAAIRIQNKFRGWKGRKEFLIIRQRIVKIQAHVRGHQVRKQYKKVIWSVGIVEKAILRWRRKGCGLRGFRTDALIGGPSAQTGSSTEDDYDFLKEGRKQTEERLQKALARVKSMVQYPEARDQYRRLLNVVTEFQERKAMQDRIINDSEEAGDGDDVLIDLEALLDDDTFMSSEC